ncbi:sigma factor [Streptomyces sp. NPDC001816]|uniref:sigma factor n=1 Tax=Streptomyces sp. NPDC001816 TaxID=3364612 RepID=UPI0036A6123B
MQHHVEERHSDAESARSLPTGDDACLAAIHRRWSALVYGLARRSLGDAWVAEDVAQQVFLGVWRGGADTGPSTVRRPAGSSASPGAGSPTPCPRGPGGRRWSRPRARPSYSTAQPSRAPRRRGTVKSHARRGLYRLRRLLGPLRAGADAGVFDA